MLANFCAWPLFGIDYHSWLVPGIGMASTAITLGLAWAFVGKRRTRVPLPRPQEGRQPSALPRDPFIYGSAAERRGALRRNGNPTAVLLTDAECKVESVRGWVVDRSTGGLCLAVSEGVEPGTILNVRAANAPPTASWIAIEVKSCRQEGDCWEIGCQFVKTPPWGLLLLFG
jgi:hypothetical protein